MQSWMFFDGWRDPLRIVIVGVLGYAGFIVVTRIAGKRTLSKMSAFDLVITVAFGSTLSTLILDERVSLAEGVLAIVVLSGLQFLVAALNSHSARAHDVIKSKPRLVFYRGELKQDALHDEQLSEAEVLAAIRKHRLGSRADVEAVVLETDGALSVIERGHGSDALRDVEGYS